MSAETTNVYGELPGLTAVLVAEPGDIPNVQQGVFSRAYTASDTIARMLGMQVVFSPLSSGYINTFNHIDLDMPTGANISVQLAWDYYSNNPPPSQGDPAIGTVIGKLDTHTTSTNELVIDVILDSIITSLDLTKGSVWIDIQVTDAGGGTGTASTIDDVGFTNWEIR